MDRTCFYKRADSRYALVAGRKVPWLYSSKRVGTNHLEYREFGWSPADDWTEQFFDDLELGQAVFVRVDENEELWPSHLWKIKVMERGGTLRVRLSDKVSDLKWSPHKELL